MSEATETTAPPMCHKSQLRRYVSARWSGDAVG